MRHASQSGEWRVVVEGIERRGKREKERAAGNFGQGYSRCCLLPRLTGSQIKRWSRYIRTDKVLS